MTAWSDIKRDLTPEQREQVDVLKGEMRAASESREAALESALRRVLSTRLHQDYGPTGEFTDCRCAACTFAQQVLRTPSEPAPMSGEELTRRLYDAADDYQASVLDELRDLASVTWTCPINPWTNMGEEDCDECGLTKAEAFLADSMLEDYVENYD